MELVCIVCPKGCRLTVTQDGVVGNTCKRGEEFAIAEQTMPKRTVTSTVATIFDSLPMLPVRTDGEIPKEKIMPLLQQIKSIKITTKLRRGDIILSNVMGEEGVNLIATSTIF